MNAGCRFKNAAETLARRVQAVEIRLRPLYKDATLAKIAGAVF
jgi:hypothetical protein